MPGEMAQLQRFVASGDTQAFSQIVHAHVGLVYGVCLRILGDKDKAADATQETFFQLLRKARDVETSVPAWLHRVASRKAVDIIRKDSSRRRSEATYAQKGRDAAETWEDLAPHVDQALNALDDETRDLLVQYYFENRSMPDIAAEKGVSHPTVSRRIEAGRVQLRQEFRKKGIIVAPAVLATLLTQNAAQAVPTTVLSQLAKVALVGAETVAGPASSTVATSTASTALSALAASAKTKAIVAVAVGAVVITGAVVYKRSAPDPSPGPDVSQPSPPPVGPVSASNPTTPVVPERQSTQPPAQEPAQTQGSQSSPESLELAGAAIGSVSSDRPAPASEETTVSHEIVSIVRQFLEAIAVGDYDLAIGLGTPGEFNREGLAQVNQAFDFQNLRITEAYLGRENAAVLTNPIPVDGRTIQIGCSLCKSDDCWLIRDVDMLPNGAAADNWLSGFRGVEPAAESIVEAY
jgi:RNA polymerase sigma-70 factor (ECF subfamily)